MYRHLIAISLLLFAGFTHAAVTLCPVVSGGLHLNCLTPRATGIAPLLVNFNCTATTDTNTLGGAGTVTQDIQYLWNFSDPGVTGKGNWLYGSKSGYQSKNLATGIVAAHLYDVADGAGNMSTTAIVTANDGTNTATCGIALTAYDPIGANGFTTANTTCYSTSGTFTGCPTGATHTTLSTFAAVNANIGGKRLLYRCGETFTGDNEAPSGNGWTIGAYPPLGQSGSCAETKTNRPIFSDTTGSSNYEIQMSAVTTDTRVSDIDFEGNVGGSLWTFINVLSVSTAPKQMTWNNLNSGGNKSTYFTQQATEFGLINSVAIAKPGSGSIALFLNTGENNCINQSNVLNCGGTPSFVTIDYLVFMGNEALGTGGTGSNVETVRISACRFCVIENNYFDNAISAAANLKFHSGNTYQSCAGWLGQKTEFVEMSDNNFGLTAGGLEVQPQNPGVDERIQNIVIERNINLTPTSSQGTRQTATSGQNITLRDNVFVLTTSGSNYPQTAIQPGFHGTCQLTGTCNSPSGTCPAGESIAGISPTGWEVYNNTVYAPSGHGGQSAVENDTGGSWGTPASSSFIVNNLFYVATGSGYTTVTNTGSGNTVSNNTANASATANPGFVNGSGALNVMSDFKPTANYSSGTTVPNLWDALGVNWSPTWSYGAVHP